MKMKSQNSEIEPSERSKPPISHSVSLALVSTLICAGELFICIKKGENIVKKSRKTKKNLDHSSK